MEEKVQTVAGPEQTVPQNTDRCDLDRTDTGRRKYIILGISALLIFTVSSNFLIIAAFVACMVIFVFPLFYSAQ